MAQSIVRGNTITLDGFFLDGENNAIDPPDPQVSIVDANGVTVVNLDTPTNVAVGHFQYDYLLPADALLGAWAARWYGTVDGFPLTDEDGFTVLRDTASAAVGDGAGQTCQPWATNEDAMGACAEYTVDPDELDVWMQVATDILWNLTGRRWGGVCSDAVRPQAQWKRWDGPPAWWPSVIATGMGGAPWGWCSCHRGRETGCARVPELRLPGTPVVPDSVVVTLDGAPFTDFRVDDSRYLVRTDGEQWPCCQNLLLPLDEPNTFGISYDYDRSPPTGGRRSAALYGCQLYLAANPGIADCSLPERATRVTRQGVTISSVDPESLLEKGQTGLPVVDAWVQSILLGNKRRNARVMVPGRWHPVRRVNS